MSECSCGCEKWNSPYLAGSLNASAMPCIHAAHIHCVPPEVEADQIKAQVREEKRHINSLTWPNIERMVDESRLGRAMRVDPELTPRLGLR